MKPTLHNLAKLCHAQLLGEIRVSMGWCVSEAPCGKVPAGFGRAQPQS
jgi:hypothetical protein